MVMYEYTIRKIGGGSRQYFNISPNKNTCPQKALNIEIGTGLMHEYEFTGSDDYTSQGKTIFGVLGIVHIFPISYLCVIADYNRDKSLRVNGNDIYEISRVELISISGEDKEANKPLKDGIKKLLSFGFYFSHTYDLTRRVQREKGDERYWWNKNLYEDFKTYNVSSSWAIKIIQGYVAYSKILVSSKNMELTLISRRRFAMAGTRFARRGIDDQGNVANFVESEQILKFGEYLLSFVQIRGSVPAFWEQKGITADLQLTRNLQMDQCAFEKHFQDLLSEYDKLVWANLLNNRRSYEMKLIQRFEELVKLYKGSNNRYLYFNFHQECTKDNYKAMDEKLKLGNCSNYLGFYISKGGNVLKKQIGVLRTNCLDCLDRTNVCQAFYAFKAFVHQLNFFRKQGLLEQEAIEHVGNYALDEGKF